MCKRDPWDPKNIAGVVAEIEAKIQANMVRRRRLDDMLQKKYLRKIRSKYNGTCTLCGDPYEEHAEVYWLPKEHALTIGFSHSECFHLRCVDQQMILNAGKFEVRFTVKMTEPVRVWDMAVTHDGSVFTTLSCTDQQLRQIADRIYQHIDPAPEGNPASLDPSVREPSAPTFRVSEQATVIIEPEARRKISDTEGIYHETKDLAEEDQEHLVLVNMDAGERLLSKITVSIGSNTSAICHPRDIMRHTLFAGAHHFALVHNHPTGDLEPSKEDINVTQRLILASRFVGVGMVDHLIVSKQGYTSIFRWMREHKQEPPDGTPGGDPQKGAESNKQGEGGTEGQGDPGSSKSGNEEESMSPPETGGEGKGGGFENPDPTSGSSPGGWSPGKAGTGAGDEEGSDPGEYEEKQEGEEFTPETKREYQELVGGEAEPKDEGEETTEALETGEDPDPDAPDTYVDPDEIFKRLKQIIEQGGGS